MASIQLFEMWLRTKYSLFFFQPPEIISGHSVLCEQKLYVMHVNKGQVFKWIFTVKTVVLFFLLHFFVVLICSN